MKREDLEAVHDALNELASDAEASDGQQLLARIKRSSKYWGQTAPNQWFGVRVVADTFYQLRGNNNNYRLSDVALGVRVSGDCIIDLTNGRSIRSNNKQEA